MDADPHKGVGAQGCSPECSRDTRELRELGPGALRVYQVYGTPMEHTNTGLGCPAIRRNTFVLVFFVIRHKGRWGSISSFCRIKNVSDTCSTADSASYRSWLHCQKIPQLFDSMLN